MIYNPRNEREFRARFSSEGECRQFFFESRWPRGFRCPRCGRGEAWRTKRALYLCRRCGSQISLTAGTLLENTHKPFRQWFEVFWRLASSWQGVSALELQRTLGLGSYQTAWELLQKARQAASSRIQLSGQIEADEAWLCCGEPLKMEQRARRALILILAQEARSEIQHVSLVRIPDASAETLRAAIERSVAPGSAIRTDGWKGYNFLNRSPYQHQVSRKKAWVGNHLLPLARRVAVRLRFWLLGTFRGAVRLSHLESYLDEFTFRYNLRSLRSPGRAFRLLVRNAASVHFCGWDHVVQNAATELAFPQWMRASGASSDKAAGPPFRPAQAIAGER